MAEEEKSLLERLKQALMWEPHNRTELVQLLRQASENKLVDIDAVAMIEGVLQVSEMQVRDIMVPRSQMIVVHQDESPEEFLPTIIDSKHSRFPVMGENRDEVIGVLLAKDLLRYMFEKHDQFILKNVLRPTVFIPESKRLNVLLREFRANRNHMAMVLDEYGGVAGLVTIEDVLEQIVGEIKDEYDIKENEHNITQIGKKQYNVKALTSIEDFNIYFNVNFSDAEFDTIGGLVLKSFGHLPKRNENINIDGFNFKVLHADNRRIRLLRVTLGRKKVS